LAAFELPDDLRFVPDELDDLPLPLLEGSLRKSEKEK
jgi:hypothetical protein